MLLQALCIAIRLACSSEIESSLNSTFCLPPLSSSSSSSSIPDLAAPGLIPPNAALPPAKLNGVLATAVPNTLADLGAPNAAKSLTTLREGEDGGDLGTTVLAGGERGGRELNEEE